MIARLEDFEISALHEGDAWKICDFMIANADRFLRYFPKTLEQNLNPTLSQQFVERKMKAYKEQREFLFTLKQTETRQLAGIIYLKNLDWKKRQGEFAYAIGYPFSGQGLASRSIKALSQFAFENLSLHTLQIIVHHSNLSSVKVATSNGFKWTATLKDEFQPTHGEALDMELYLKHHGSSCC